ncbi:MAG: OmpA family protein [Niabella sp.]
MINKSLQLSTFLLLSASVTMAQSDFDSPRKAPQIGFSANLTDFSASLPKIGKVDPGFSVFFWNGLTNHLDYSLRYNGLFSSYQKTGTALSRYLDYKNEAELSLHLKALSDDHLFNPFLTGGIGLGNYAKKIFTPYAPLGLGLQVNLFSEGYIYLQGNYRLPINDKKLDKNTFFSLGVAQRLGRRKEVPPPPPPPVVEKDTDNDGIIDSQDACPTVAGPAENKGCPWPDTDGDGVLDKDDACPTVSGPAENKGCPWPDTDGDGILDKDDKCPDVAGVAQYKGCPPPAEVITKKLQAVYFDFNKATIKSESSEALDDAAEIIKGAGEERFVLVGMTDKKGNDTYNLNLSKQRAKAVMDALEARGVSTDQLKSMGIGEQEAIVAEDASDEERQADRKVVVKSINNEDEWKIIKKSDAKTRAVPVKKKKRR